MRGGKTRQEAKGNDRRWSEETADRGRGVWPARVEGPSIFLDHVLPERPRRRTTESRSEAWTADEDEALRGRGGTWRGRVAENYLDGPGAPESHSGSCVDIGSDRSIMTKSSALRVRLARPLMRQHEAAHGQSGRLTLHRVRGIAWQVDCSNKWRHLKQPRGKPEGLKQGKAETSTRCAQRPRRTKRGCVSGSRRSGRRSALEKHRDDAARSC